MKWPLKTDAETGFALVEADAGQKVLPFRDFGDGFTAFGGQEDFEFDSQSGDYLVISEDGRIGDRLRIIACAQDPAALEPTPAPAPAAAAPPPAPKVAAPKPAPRPAPAPAIAAPPPQAAAHDALLGF